MQHLRSSTSSNLIDSPLDDQEEEVNAEASSPDTQETSEVTSPDDTEDPVTEDKDNKTDNETVEDPADNKEDNVSEETDQMEDQEDTSQETDQTEDQEETSQDFNEQVEEETGESQTIIISMPEAPGEEPVTYEYITVSPSSNDIAVDFTETNTYLSIICVILLFFTIVCICRYIYKFFSIFF